ncbi:MAG TPA: hypothetical protein VGB24_10630 [Longimicrobium sp.]|jgi:hypothetical protein
MVEEHNPATDVLQRQRAIRFDDLDEVFLARLLLRKVLSPRDAGLITINVDLSTLFQTMKSHEEALEMADVRFLHSPRMVEDVFGMLASITGPISPPRQEYVAKDFYLDRLRKHLHFLQCGDHLGFPPIIRAWKEDDAGRFSISLDAAEAIERLGQAITCRLTLANDLLAKLPAGVTAGLPRIDLSKELDLLRGFLERRQELTGENVITFAISEVPFRHAIARYGDSGAMPSPATCGPAERVLLPLFLEASGVLDIIDVGLASSPAEPNDLSVVYSIRIPPRDNLYSVEYQGLSPADRRGMSEFHLSVYQRIHKEMQARWVFAGRPELERSFAALACWLIRKLDFSLEQSSFLCKPAREWLASQDSDQVRMEDEFFLPFVHERLFESFGTRVKRKPEAFAGEVDLLIDEIPLELKVRRGNTRPLGDAIVDDTYRPASQAAAYAARTRLGMIAVLDILTGPPTVTNLDTCVFVKERNSDTSFPTCIAVFVFHCHPTVPSRLK